MTQKTALVTGGTSGVGLSLVRELASRGMQVHFIGTSDERGKRIEEELSAGGASGCRFIQLDLSSLRRVLDFTADFKSEVSALERLVNVAGVMLPRRQETHEGVEKTLAIGHLSAFLLNRELAPLLARGHQPRMLNVSGGPAQVLKPGLDFDDLDFTRNYSGIRAAIRAVHAKTVLTEVFAEKLRGDSIDVNAFHPGTVKSDLGRNLSFPLRSAFRVARLFMSKASKSGIHVCTAPEIQGVTGQLFVGKKPRALGFDDDYKTRVWRVTEERIERALS